MSRLGRYEGCAGRCGPQWPCSELLLRLLSQLPTIEMLSLLQYQPFVTRFLRSELTAEQTVDTEKVFSAMLFFQEKLLK